MYKKIESMFYVLCILGWFIGSQLLVGSFISYLLSIKGISYASYYEEHRYAMTLSAQVICLGILLYLDKRTNKQLREKLPLKLYKIGYYVLGGIGLWVLASLINYILLPYFPDYTQIDMLFNNKEAVGRFVVLVIAAPLLEEYVFREKVQSHLKRSFGVPVAIIGQALFFGSMHGLRLQQIYTAVLGVGLGIIKEKEKNLQSTIIMHMTLNFIGWAIGTLTL